MRASPLVVVLALVGCGSPGEGENQPPARPEVALGPDEPDTRDELTVSLLSPLSDPDGDTVTLRLQWSRDGVVVPSLADALTVDPDETTKDEDWSVRAWAEDRTGLTSEPVDLTVDIENAPPTVGLSTDPAPPTSVDPIRLLLSPEDPDDDDVEVAITWRLEGNPAPEWDGFQTIPESETVRGQRWTVTAVPDDGDDAGDAETLEIVIGDGPPVLTSVAITPDDPQEADAITGTVRATDPEGDALTYETTWLVNGAPVGAPAVPSVDGAWFDKGDTVVAEVVAVSEAGGRSAPMRSNTVTVANTAPELVGATIAPTAGDEATVFTCAPDGLTDVDPADTPTWTVTWLVNGSVATTGPSLTGASFRRGDRLTCRIVGSDGTESTPTRTSDAVVVGNALPTASAATLSPSVPTEAAPITVGGLVATDLDGDTITWRYAWRVNGTLVAATTASLAPTAFVRGDSVVAEVTPFDGTATGAALTTAPVVVGNAAPEITRLTFTPALPNAHVDLSVATVATDLDGDVLTPVHAWTIGGVPAGSSGPILEHALLTRGDAVSVTVSVDDGFGGTDSATASTTIGNAPPSAPVVSLEPQDPFSGDDLLCQLDAYGTDPDGDAVTHSFRWTVNGVTYNGATTVGDSSTVRYTSIRPGQSWACWAVASDGSLSTESARQTVVVSPVTCGLNAEDNGLGVCVCDAGADWCDASQVDCCVFAPPTVDVTVVRASIAATKPDGTDWDAIPLFWDPDVYVDVRVSGGLVGSTAVVDDDLTPSWRTVFGSLAISEFGTIGFALRDDDTVGDDPVGSFTLDYGDILSHLDQGEFTLSGGSVNTFVLRIDTP